MEFGISLKFFGTNFSISLLFLLIVSFKLFVFGKPSKTPSSHFLKHRIDILKRILRSIAFKINELHSFLFFISVAILAWLWCVVFIIISSVVKTSEQFRLIHKITGFAIFILRVLIVINFSWYKTTPPLLHLAIQISLWIFF